MSLRMTRLRVRAVSYLLFSRSCPRKAEISLAVDVYIVDSGVWALHEEFIVPGSDGATRVKCVYSASNDQCDDPHGHGTALASLVGGAHLGVAKKSNLLAVKVATPDGKAWYSEVMKALEFVWSDATGPNPAVVLMSWGFVGGSAAPLDEVMQKVRGS